MTSASPEILDKSSREPLEIKCSIHEEVSLKAYPVPNITDEEYDIWKLQVQSQCFCTICGC